MPIFLKRSQTGVRVVAVAVALLTMSFLGCRGFFQSPLITGLALNPSSLVVGQGSTLQVTATATYDDGSTGNASNVTWTSSDNSIATVSSSGVVTGVATGTATITAAANGITGTATANVIPGNLTLITITPANPSISYSQSQSVTFKATGSVSTGGTVDLTNIATWTSSNTSVATISSSGVASLLSPSGINQTTISAQAGNITGSTTLTVSP